jgi:hypothetical protein
MPPFLLSSEAFTAFLDAFAAGTLPRAEWSHAAHLAAATALIHGGGTVATVRERILRYNESQGIVSTPDYGYHETVTCFWVERIGELIGGLGRNASAYDAARAVVAAFAHRGRLFDSYYSYNLFESREARAAYLPPDIPDILRA